MVVENKVLVNKNISFKHGYCAVPNLNVGSILCRSRFNVGKCIVQFPFKCANVYCAVPNLNVGKCIVPFPFKREKMYCAVPV